MFVDVLVAFPVVGWLSSLLLCAKEIIVLGLGYSKTVDVLDQLGDLFGGVGGGGLNMID